MIITQHSIVPLLKAAKERYAEDFNVFLEANCGYKFNNVDDLAKIILGGNEELSELYYERESYTSEDFPIYEVSALDVQNYFNR